MAITQNQLTDIFEKQAGRVPTPYEVNKYSTASIQQLANLGQTFKSLNTDNSISDYLTSVGQDSSLQNRALLGQKYGIADIGTPQGNTALLRAMKGGTPTSSVTPPTVAGTVPITPTTPVQTTVDTPTVPSDQQQNQMQGTLNSAIAPVPDQNYSIPPAGIQANDPQNAPKDATATDSSDPIAASQKTVDDAYGRQQSAQAAVADIDRSIAKLKSDKMAEIARVGGVVNESQLTSELIRDNQPLLDQRKQLVGEYTQANQSYQKAIQDKRTADANFYKGQQLDQGQQKIDNQSNQFTQRLEQQGWKQSKVNVYDEYGNVTGQQLVWQQNPGSSSGVTADGTTVQVKQGSQGAGISSTGSLGPAQNNPGALKYTAYTASLGATDSGIVDHTDGSHFAAFPDSETGSKAQASLLKSGTYANMTLDAAMKKYSNGGYGADVVKGIDPNTKMKDLTDSQIGTLQAAIQKREGVSGSSSAPQTVELHTDSTFNIDSPGYATANVTFNGKNTQLTQAYIDKVAIAAIMNGGNIPSSAARGTKGLPIVQTDAIKARIGQLDPGGNLVANKAQAAAWGKALTSQVDYATKIQRALDSADSQFAQILDRFGGTGINDNKAPLSNFFSNAKKYNLGDTDVAAFKSSLAELSRQYSQVFSSSGRTTDATNKTANDIINGNLSIDALKAVQSQLNTLGKIDVDQANASVDRTLKSLNGVSGDQTGSATGIPKGSMDDSSYVDKILTSGGYKYDDFVKQVPKGKIAVIQNSDGTIGYLDNEGEYNASTYTRI